MRELVKTAVISSLALGGVWASVKIWPLNIGGASRDNVGDDLLGKASPLLDLLPDSVVRQAENALQTVEAEISQQVAKRVAVGVFAGVLVGVVIAC